MRIKMRSLVSFLGFAVGLFMLADVLLFSSVGHHRGRARSAEGPYHLPEGRFLQRQIKSGKEYLSEGIKHIADRLSEGDPSARYDGVRDSVLDAMEVPGMRQKILPMDGNRQLEEVGLSGDLYRLQQLERDLIRGTLHEEDQVADFSQDPEENVNEEAELTVTTEQTDHEDNRPSSDGQEFGFSWSRIFGLGQKESAEADAQGDTNWNIEDMNAAGLDSSILSKLAHVQEEKQDPDSASPGESLSLSSQDLENERLTSELRQFKDMANSIPEWKDDVPKPAATPYPDRSPADSTGDQTDKAQAPGTIQRFISSFFQPLSFAGTTGDEDKDDGGWASVGELDNLDTLFDKVNGMMIPGVNQKLLPQESALMQQKETAQESAHDEGVQSSEPSLKVNMVAVPGFETDFFQKYAGMKSEETRESATSGTSLDQSQISERLHAPELTSDFLGKFFQSADAQAEVPPAVPEGAAGAAEPAAGGGQPDTLQVPSIPGLTDDFFNKYSKQKDASKESDAPAKSLGGAAAAGFSAEDIKVPNIPGLTDTFFDKYSGKLEDIPDESAPQNDETSALQIPNIPGLTDEFFSKYGVQKPSEETRIDGYQAETRDAQEPEAPVISPDFFDKFIHPVAQGHAPPEVAAESFQGVPGLPADFFNKFMKGQASEETGTDYEGVPGEGVQMPDMSGLEDYFNKYLEDSDLLPGEKVGFESLKESLEHAQHQVPGMPEKVMPDDIIRADPGLPEVPPSEYPELDEATPHSGVLSYLMSKLLGTKKQQFGEGLPVLPPGFNLSIPDEETIPQHPLWATSESGNDTEEGFRVRRPGQEELDLGKIFKALMPNASSANESLGLSDARDFLSQLEGIMPSPGRLSEEKGNMSEKLANITSLEDSRVVECNLTKSPFWKVAITDRWHTVQDGLMFVYSAYLDDRILGHTAIRILGILEGWEVGMHLKPYCQVWFQDKAKPFVVGATYEWLPGQPIAKFKAVLLTCVYQTSHVEGKPLAVSLTTEPCDQPKFLVKIHTRNETVGVRKTNFTICLTGPMKFGYADVGQFIQWMEFNIMMGVERFVLYNHSMDAALRPYLVHYAKLGYVQLFPWIIPDNIPNPLVFLKNLGHLAMINDCLYRNMWTSRYVIFMDIDEMILPRYGHVTFDPMLRNAGCHRKPQAVVQSVFFRREWPNDELYNNNQTVLNMGLVGLLKTKRERKIWPPYMRSKYFIKPDEVLICNVHAAHTFLSPLEYQDLSCIFNPKEVILHHYRYWGEVTGNYVVDRRLHEYADELITRASAIYEAVLGRKVT